MSFLSKLTQRSQSVPERPVGGQDFLRTLGPDVAPRSRDAALQGCHLGLDAVPDQERARNPVEAAFFAQDDRVVNKWRHYLEVYDRHLARYRETSVRFLEIGVFQGGSLQMWRRYLGAAANLHGLDVDPRCAQVDDPDLHIHIGSQTDTALLRRIVEAMGGVDVVIDDGSHVSEHQIATFECLYPLLAPDGLYIVEDVHASYWPDYGGGLRTPGAFMEYAKDLLDRLHAHYVLDPDPVARDPGFADVTLGIAFHDSMVIFEKRPKGPPKSIATGRRWIF